MIHVYYGGGKGKTTAAMGLMVRALGRGRRAIAVQFLKKSPSGEVETLRRLPGASVWRASPEEDFTQERFDGMLRQALDAARAGDCDLLVLDEALDALQHGMLDPDLVREALDMGQKDLELVITGHKPEPWVFEKADYLTRMVKEKHPYDRGVRAREGVEY